MTSAFVILALLSNGILYVVRYRVGFAAGSGALADETRRADALDVEVCELRRELMREQAISDSLAKELDQAFWTSQRLEPRAKLEHGKTVNRG